MRDLKIYRVEDIQVESAVKANYDASFFAAGYEERCTALARLLMKSRIGVPIVIGFKELNHSEQRKLNDTYFLDWTNDQLILGSNDDKSLYDVLRELFGGSKRRIRILVDYSSMSRLWYTAILNWARFSPGPTEIQIDFVYSIGSHQANRRPMVINDVLCLPGCEGNPHRISGSVAVFGLGFEGLAALCVLDRLEPKEVFSYFACPAAFEDYPGRTRDANEELLEHSDAVFELPIRSVERTFSQLAEIVSPYLGQADITFIPMGPKPHTLAAILLAMRFEEITCLRVSGVRPRAESVQPSGDFVASTVHFITS